MAKAAKKLAANASAPVPMLSGFDRVKFGLEQMGLGTYTAEFEQQR